MRKILLLFLILACILSSCKTPKDQNKKIETDTVSTVQKRYVFEKQYYNSFFYLEPNYKNARFVSLEEDKDSAREILDLLDENLYKDSYDASIVSENIFNEEMKRTEFISFFVFKNLNPLNANWLEDLFENDQFILKSLDGYKAPISCLYFTMNDRLVCANITKISHQAAEFKNTAFIEYVKSRMKEWEC